MPENNKASVKLSVCIATYNRLDYLKLTLENVIKELSDINFEIIIADGGSTDGTINYIKELNNKVKNILLIEQGCLVGAAKAHIECYRKAEGKYVVSLSDHCLINGKIFIQSINLLDKESEIAGVMQKLYITLRKQPYATYHHKFPYITTQEVIIWRRENIDYVEKNYHTHYWMMDLVIDRLVSGKTIVHTKQLSFILIKIEHFDLLHDQVRKNKISKIDREYFTNKWTKLKNIIEADLTITQKNRVFVFTLLLNGLLRVIKSRYFVFIANLLYKLGYNRKLPNLYTGIYGRDRPAAFNNQLYSGLGFPIIENIVDWLYEKTSVFTVKNYINDKNFFLCQRMPSSISSKYNVLE